MKLSNRYIAELILWADEEGIPRNKIHRLIYFLSRVETLKWAPVPVLRCLVQITNAFHAHIKEKYNAKF